MLVKDVPTSAYGEMGFLTVLVKSLYLNLAMPSHLEGSCTFYIETNRILEWSGDLFLLAKFIVDLFYNKKIYVTEDDSFNRKSNTRLLYLFD